MTRDGAADDHDPIEDLCETLHRDRPDWITGGSLSHAGTKFLAQVLVRSGASTAVEVGAASGFSAAVLVAVLDARHRAGCISGPIRVDSFDANEQWYVDPSRRTGDAVAEMVPELSRHVTFHMPATARKINEFFENDSIEFLFIDANHSHPWPTLDMMMSLQSLAPGALVALDDINLPVLSPQFPAWGAHHLFYGLDIERDEGAANGKGLPSMGMLRVPDDKTELHEQLLHVLDANEWQVEVPDSYVNEARRRIR